MGKASFLSKAAMAAGVFAAMAFTASCSNDKDDNSGGPPSLPSSSSGSSSSSAKQSAVYGDSLTYGGETYPTVVIGRQENAPTSKP